MRFSDKNDKQKIENFLEMAPRYSTLLMRGAARDAEAFKGWWMGALAAGTNLQALMCVEGTAGNLFGEEDDAIETLAEVMYDRIKSGPRGPSRAHQLLGPERVIDIYWRIFQKVNRTVIFDRKRKLFSTTGPVDPPKPDITIAKAQPNDLKLIYEFSGEQMAEQWKLDPRRAYPDAHKERCRKLIESGHQLVGRDRGRPVFIAELVPVEDRAVMVDRIFVPRPFRVRKKMVASAMIILARQALEDVDEVLYFSEIDNDMLMRCAEIGEFKEVSTYRLIVMRS